MSRHPVRTRLDLAALTLISSLAHAHAGHAQASPSACSAGDGLQRYVANDGDDGADGSSRTPWLTIQHAASSAVPGTTVNIRGGVYKESVRVEVSGEPCKPIIFRSAPGETAIVDGSGLRPTPRDGDESDLGLFTLQNRSDVTIQGFELRSFTTQSTEEVPAGIVVRGAGARIALRDNHVHHIETRSSSDEANAFGIVVKGTDSSRPITELVIDGNEVDHLKTGQSESVVVNGNVDGFTISHNEIHDNNNIGIDCIGHEGVGARGEGNTNPNDAARNGTVSDNVVYNISSIDNPAYHNEYGADGIYVDGGNHIVIERNVVYGNDINIEIASEWKGDATSYVTVRNNLIYNALTCGLSMGGYDSQRGGTQHCAVVNNTLFGNDTKRTGGGELQIQHYVSDNVFKNNIVYGQDGDALVTGLDATGVDIDYNLFYARSKGSAIGKHATFADPQLVSTAGQLDLHVRVASPAIGAGTALSASVLGATDADGNPRVVGSVDLGAYEQ
jgi:hypothetical protein